MNLINLATQKVFQYGHFEELNELNDKTIDNVLLQAIVYLLFNHGPSSRKIQYEEFKGFYHTEFVRKSLMFFADTHTEIVT